MAPFILLMLTVIMVAVEKFANGRPWKDVDGWYPRAIFFTLCQAIIVFLTSTLLAKYFGGLPIYHIENDLGAVGSTLCAYLLVSFVFYWWHRARHDIPFLWDKIHQIHHSAQRLEVLTATYKHPLEIWINSLFMTFIMFELLGISPEAATVVALMKGGGELFVHWNIKTPQWIGYFIQRPEAHCVHHQRGWHSQNYSDFPLWDLIFGTFHNPKSFDGLCGFEDDKEKRLKDMLLGKDVSPLR